MRSGLKVGLALGGGAARGLAHLGVLKVLEENRIPVDLIIGTSVGALIGGVYATTRDAAMTEKRFHEFIFSKAFKRARFDFLKESREARRGVMSRVVTLFKKGIFYSFSVAKTSWVSAEYFEHNINALLDDVPIEKAGIPFHAVAADMLTGDLVVLSQGGLRRAVSASSAVPGLLPPVSIDGRLLIDGGWVAQVPVVPALDQGCDLVIAVDVSRELEPLAEQGSGLNIMVRAAAIRAEALRLMQGRLADILIEPDVGRVHWADFSAVDECVRRGEEATRARIADIRHALRIARWPSFVGFSRTRRLARAQRERARVKKVS
ncbi:MAG TPA: patatin-like phospholipase family protein [Dongiaceae bacterium]|nr:patatin-like phospholipase family protein [Dongiaceae bacterium]